jgi:hypothetical protein
VVRIGACNGDRFLRTDYVSPRTVASRTTAGSRQPLLVHARKSSQMGGGALQRRFVSHGGLTPPALGFVCGRRCRCGLTADESVSFSHGWLTPPALVLQCERLPAKKRFLRCTNAHPTKSGGRQPAVGSIAPRGQCTANNVGRVTIVQSRAAGVSPPWFGLALATATGFCRPITFRPAQSLPAPRLAYASRSWSHARKSSQMGGGALQRRSVFHGGLTPPLLVSCAGVVADVG